MRSGILIMSIKINEYLKYLQRSKKHKEPLIRRKAYNVKNQRKVILFKILLTNYI